MKFIGIFFSLVMLIACGPQMTLKINVDALALIPEAKKSGEFVLLAGQDIKMPEEGISSSEFNLDADIYENLHDFTLELVAGVLLGETDQPMTLNAGVYFSKIQPVFEAEPIGLSFVLEPNVTQDISFSLAINEQKHAELLDLLRDGDFILGIAYSIPGDENTQVSLATELKQLDLSFSADLPVPDPLSR
jgi:hypothetical protein